MHCWGTLPPVSFRQSPAALKAMKGDAVGKAILSDLRFLGGTGVGSIDKRFNT